ncbi:MAG: hypothetical protein QGF67_01355 [Lentisphaeria bacterium]|jgi:hypothetical protein|nr:hypothetical protein [Lentisphaeria bacterium]MDP7740058.1 hypothetical protein [Lentisphaeria bacterium]|tara:strand:+ start:136 stop:648 length:513 start_codon:yes stop_codon:yes gene_type:complete
MLIKLIMLSALGYLGYANRSVIENARYTFDKIRGEQITSIEMKTIRRIIVYYHTEHETLPNPASFTKFLEENTREMAGKDTRKNGVDIWGTPYVLEIEKKDFTVCSAGADQQWNTDDDIRLVQAIDGVRSVEQSPEKKERRKTGERSKKKTKVRKLLGTEWKRGKIGFDR